MIVVDVEPLSAAAAAARIGAGRLPSWLCSPGSGELHIEREFLACDPVVIVRGEAPGELAAAWTAARDRWGARPETPVAVGSIAYDLGRARAPGAMPGMDFRFYDAFWVREAASGRAQIWACSDQAAARLQARIAGPADEEAIDYQLGQLADIEPPARHLLAIARVKEYLLAGDVYQVNLARRLRARCRSMGPVGLGLFRRLIADAPAPHALWMGDHERAEALVGNSPERFLRLHADRTIETAPIKGTRPRGVGAADAAIARELRENPKDRAEHVMIVDLERNDLGRICQTGSVEVRDGMRLLALPSVQHLVTTVRGRLRDDVGLEAIRAACFPGGSVTGAPKIRAMQIIDELEPTNRGLYGGTVGYFGAGGDMDHAITIRTLVFCGDEYSYQAGAGIVADSVPETEYEEVLAKSGSMIRGLQMVEGGL